MRCTRCGKTGSPGHEEDVAIEPGEGGRPVLLMLPFCGECALLLPKNDEARERYLKQLVQRNEQLRKQQE
jgi:hypothetical protein